MNWKPPKQDRSRQPSKPMFRLLQSAVERGELIPLDQALANRDPVDASGLTLSATDLSSLRDRLPVGGSGTRSFRRWGFSGSHFGEGCDFSGCALYACDLSYCHFEHGVTFNGAVFDRARFVGARFANDAALENVDFGVKAEFREATFGDRARFGYSHFGSCQFAMVQFGESASFARTQFESRARFHNARFGGRAGFTEAWFDGGCDFGGVDFGEKLQMIGIRCLDSAS